MRIFASHQCADYACTSYVGASEERMAPVMFAVGLGEAVWCLNYLSPDGPAAATGIIIMYMPANFDHLRYAYCKR